MISILMMAQRKIARSVILLGNFYFLSLICSFKKKKNKKVENAAVKMFAQLAMTINIES